MRKPLFLFALVCLYSFHALSQPKGSIIVEGKASVKQIPQIMDIQVPITTKDISYKVCNEKLQNTVNKLQEELAKLKIDKNAVHSDDINVREDFDWDKGKRIKNGYIGSVSLTISTDFSPKLLNDIISVLQQESYDFGYNLNFSLSENQKEQLGSKAIEIAVKDAKSKAAKLAESAGVKLGYITSIKYDYSNVPISPLMMVENESMRLSKSSDSGANINLNPSEISIEKKVIIEWAIEY